MRGLQYLVSHKVMNSRPYCVAGLLPGAHNVDYAAKRQERLKGHHDLANMEARVIISC